MKNILELLERHVQWFVLGLAGLYLAWMAWSYVILSPVTVKLDGKDVTPAEIDRRTLQGPAAKLNEAIKNTETPKFEVRDYVVPFTNRISQPASSPEFALAKVAFQSADATLGKPPETTLITTAVTELIVAPAPELLGITHGASSVAIPGKVTPEKPIPEVTNVDKFWSSVGAKIPMQALIAEYERTKLNVQRNVPPTAVLLVELERQEMLSNGQWGPPKPIDPLVISRVLPWPNGKDRQLEYAKWATDNAGEIQYPPFYVVQIGDNWVSPLPLAPGAKVDAPAAPPLPEIDRAKAPPAGIPDDLRIKWLQEHKKWQDEQKPKRPPVTPRPPREGVRPGGAMGVDENGQRIQYAQNRPMRPLPPGSGMMPGDLMPNERPDRGPFEMSERPPGAFPPGAVPPGPGAPALGGFVPAAGMQDIQIFAHDDSAEPGKSYRYRIRYRLRNPLFNTRGMANPQTLADQFEVISPFSAWTTKVSTFETTNFAVAGGVRRDQGRADFNIYRWQAGRWNKTKVTRSPGDAITDGTLDTGATFIDIRAGDREDYLLIAMPDGKIIVRSYQVDMQNPEIQKLNASSNLPTPAAAAGAAPTAAGR